MRKILFLFILTVFLFSKPVFADEEAKTLSTEEIPFSPFFILVSRLPSFDTELDEVPYNVTHKSREDLSRKHSNTFQEAVEDIEGALLFDQVGNGIDANFGLRGFTESSAVVYLVDGVRVNEVDGAAVNFPLLVMSDVDSVQIDRGSASPVYGSNAFAGVVHITTGKPSDKPISIFGGFDWSSFDGVRFNQGVSGTLKDKWIPLGGAFKYYFNGGRNVSNGFKTNSEYRITSFDIKLSYELPEDTGRFHFGFKHIDDAISNPGELTLSQYQATNDQTLKPLDGRDFKNSIISFGGEKKFWDNKIVTSVLASWRTNLIHFYSTSATFVDFVTGSNPDTDLTTNKTRQTDLIWQAAYEDTFKGFKHRSLIGMEFRDASEYSLQQDAFGGNVNEAAARETERSSSTSSISLFWQEKVNFFKKVIAHVGVRHDLHRLKTTDDLTPTNNQSIRLGKSSISTGLVFKLRENMDVFANYSQGFRIPTISELAPFAAGLNANLQAEESDSYEIGTRLRFGDKASFKASYFLIDLENEIVFDSTSLTPATPFGRNINIGESRRTGVEASLQMNPIQEVNLYGTYTWTHAYVRETDGGGALADERTLGQVPENRMSFGLHCWPLKRLGEPFEGLRLSMNGVFTGKQHPTAFESTAQATLNATGSAGHIIKSYSIWNMVASYAWRENEVFLKVNNVFDNNYYGRAVSATSFGTAIVPAGTFTFVTPGAPREYVLGFRWKF